MNLSPQEISAWFREHAKRFNEIADTLDQTFAAGAMPAVPVRSDSQVRSRSRGKPTAEHLIRIVKTGGHRVSGLARMFHVPPEEIRAIIKSPDSGLKIIRRGWVKPVDQL